MHIFGRFFNGEIYGPSTQVINCGRSGSHLPFRWDARDNQGHYPISLVRMNSGFFSKLL
jgi:hypothetical protein